MTRFLPFVFILLVSTGMAQIPNGSLEDWVQIDIFEDPDDYVTSNVALFFQVVPLSVTKVSSPKGNAVRLETFNASAKLTNGSYWNNGTGGTPYTEEPDSIVALVKHNLVANDEASIRVEFSSGGVLVAFGQISLNGLADNYTRVSAPISSFTQAPDMVNLVVQSSMNNSRGSVLEIEEIVLVGANEQLPNHNFENWTELVSEDPQFWTTYNLFNVAFKEELTVRQVEGTDPGTFAAEFSTQLTQVFGQPSINGLANTSGVTPGGAFMPIDFSPEVLEFDYKYQSTEPDSGILAVQFLTFPNGQPTSLGTFFVGLQETMDWEKATIDISLTAQPDSFGLFVAPDAQEAFRQVPQLGRVLTIDNLAFDMNTSLVNQSFERVQCYPNPTPALTRVEGLPDGDSYFYVLNGLAQQVLQGRHSGEILEVDLSSLRPGKYYILVESSGKKMYTEVIKQ